MKARTLILCTLLSLLGSALTAQQAPSPNRAPATPDLPAEQALPEQASSTAPQEEAEETQESAKRSMDSTGLEPGTIKAFQVKGDVKVYEEDNLIGKLRRGQDLHQGMTIVTAQKSGALLMFSNGSTLNVGEQTKLELTVFLQAPFDASQGRYAMLKEDPSTSKAHSFLHFGEAIGTVKKLKSTSIFDIESPIGTAGIRGTTFYVSYGLNENSGNYMMQVSNFDGEVIIESALEAQLVMSDGSVAAGRFNPYSGPKLYQVPKQTLVILEAPADLPLGPKELMPSYSPHSDFSDFFGSSNIQSMLQEINAVTGNTGPTIFTPGGPAGPAGLIFDETTDEPANLPSNDPSDDPPTSM